MLTVAETEVVLLKATWESISEAVNRNMLAIHGESPDCRAVQDKIKEVADAYLPVGQALLVATGHERVPFLISAPTMFLPEPIKAANCRLAMEAVLRLARSHEVECADVSCPGLGTGVGRVPPDEAAAAMRSAYAAVATK